MDLAKLGPLDMPDAGEEINANGLTMTHFHVKAATIQEVFMRKVKQVKIPGAKKSAAESGGSFKRSTYRKAYFDVLHRAWNRLPLTATSKFKNFPFTYCLKDASYSEVVNAFADQVHSFLLNGLEFINLDGVRVPLVTS